MRVNNYCSHFSSQKQSLKAYEYQYRPRYAVASRSTKHIQRRNCAPDTLGDSMNLDRLHCRKRASATSQPPSTVNERVTGLQQTTDELNSHLTMTSRHVANNNDGGGEEEDDDDDDVSTKEYNATDNDATDATDAATKSTTWNRSNFVNEFDIRTSTTTHRQTNTQQSSCAGGQWAKATKAITVAAVAASPFVRSPVRSPPRRRNSNAHKITILEYCKSVTAQRRRGWRLAVAGVARWRKPAHAGRSHRVNAIRCCDAVML